MNLKELVVKKNILITGSSGLLGSNLCYHLRNKYSITGIDLNTPLNINNVKSYSIDLKKKEQLEKFLHSLSPNIIIHCAAIVNLDWCEDHAEDAMFLHRDVTRIIRNACPDALFIYISTDAFYSQLGAENTENDIVKPLSVYARTKLEGEKELEDFPNNSLSIRTCFYGINYQNKLSLAEWMWRKLSSGEEFTGFTDVYFSPILVNDLAEIIEKIINKKLVGIYNVGSHDYCSKYEFAIKISKLGGFSVDLVKSGLSSEKDFKAQRPLAPILNVTKIENVLNRTMLTVDEGLYKYKELIDSQFKFRLRGEQF